MFTQIIEYTIWFIAISFVFVIWPSTAQYPLPQTFFDTIVQVSSKAKNLIELPILDHLWFWFKFYSGIFMGWFLFKLIMKVAPLLTGKDRSIKISKLK